MNLDFLIIGDLLASNMGNMSQDLVGRDSIKGCMTMGTLNNEFITILSDKGVVQIEDVAI